MHIYLNNPFIGYAYVPHILNAPCHENAYVPHVSLIWELSAPSHFKSLSLTSGVRPLESPTARGRAVPSAVFFMCASDVHGRSNARDDG